MQEVISDIDKDRLLTEREKLLTIIKARTNNPTVELEIIVNEKLVPPKERPLTKQERFQNIVNQNPSLQKLQENFGAKLID
ncbi:MAG: hypothetical protein LC115_08685 [Bacteroidia bacterium]|nr:hypothetical protein [Bacteroidia bacterium]